MIIYSVLDAFQVLDRLVPIVLVNGEGTVAEAPADRAKVRLGANRQKVKLMLIRYKSGGVIGDQNDQPEYKGGSHFRDDVD